EAAIDPSQIRSHLPEDKEDGDGDYAHDCGTSRTPGFRRARLSRVAGGGRDHGHHAASSMKCIPAISAAKWARSLRRNSVKRSESRISGVRGRGRSTVITSFTWPGLRPITTILSERKIASSMSCVTKRAVFLSL